MSIEILHPDNQASAVEKYTAAWSGLRLQGNPQAHAKCWLTYRAIDGGISFEDWVKHVSSASPKADERWVISMLAAEGMLFAKKGDYANAIKLLTGASSINPTSASSVRASCVLSHCFWAIGNNERAIDGALAWQAAVSRIDLSKYPLWVVDGGHNLSICAHACLRLAANAGLIQPMKTSLKWRDVLLHQCDEIWWDVCKSILATRPSSRSDLAFCVPKSGTFVELGVARGDFADELLRNGDLKYLGIDKWDDERHGVEEYNGVMKRFSSNMNVAIVRDSFESALHIPFIAANKFDVVYVDGYAHTGQDNGKTLDLWWPKVADGGVFAGHDYDDAYPLTKAAVDSFTSRNGLKVNVILEKPFGSWWMRKN